MRRIVITLFSLLVVAGSIPPQPASALDPIPLKVAILGDSFSAGNGARRPDGSSSFYGPVGCYRSRDSWGEQYADYLQTGGYRVTLINRACSGAVMDDVLLPKTLGSVPWRNTVPGTWGMDDPELLALVKTAHPSCGTPRDADERYVHRIVAVTHVGSDTIVDYACDHFLDAQIDAVGEDTDLLLLTIGGNDADFETLVTECFIFGPQDPDGCRQEVTDANGALGGLRAELEIVLEHLRQKMRPDAQIVLIGYPYLELSRNFAVGDYVAGGPIRDLGDAGDAAAQAAVDAVNTAANSTNVRFVPNVKSAFAGHEPDGGSDINPDGWFWEPPFSLFTLFGIDWAELYHPNPDGHAGWSEALTPFLSFGAVGQELSGDVDIVFAIDTTGSMEEDIDAVKQFTASFLDLVADLTATHRVAVVTYRDHPEHTGDPFFDYPARVEIGFTEDDGAVTAEINSINVAGGGDIPESVYSGLIEAINLPWRPGVKKMVIQLGDAGPHDPEPVTGYTSDDVVAAAFAVDPAEVYVVDVSSSGAVAPELQDIADQTNGGVYFAPTPQEVALALATAVEEAVAKPYAWAGGPYVARINEPVLLDGSGSFDGDGSIVSYEWDLNADGSFDTTSSDPTHLHTFASAYEGLVVLRVTDNEGKIALATSLAHASVDGDQMPDEEDNCPNEPNHGQSDYDGDGVGDACDETPGFEWTFTEPTTARVSVASDGSQASADSGYPAISADGRYVAFHTSAALVAGDTNGVDDVYVRDRANGATEHVSLSSAGAQASEPSDEAHISGDGRYVVFRSQDDTLVTNDTHSGGWDAFVHDRLMGTTSLISVASDGTPANATSYGPTISADGQVVAFHSFASNLVAGDTNGDWDVFVRDLTSGVTERVSLSSAGAQGNGDSEYPTLSGDGRWVAFRSLASNLVAADTNAVRDIFVHDRLADVTTRANVSSSGAQAGGSSQDASISADGSVVAFTSAASDLVAGDTNGNVDAFVHELASGTTSRVSLSSSGGQGSSGNADEVDISADGRFVTFYATFSTLVSGDTNSRGDIFVHDRTSGATTRVSIGVDGSQTTGGHHSRRPAISGDGSVVAFETLAANLVADDTNAAVDIFVRGPTWQ